MEDVIAERGQAGNPYAYQLSILKDRNISLQWIRRAEGKLQLVLLSIMTSLADQVKYVEAGYKAIFITVDAPVIGNRLSEKRNDFDLPPNLSLPNLPESANKSHRIPGRDPSNSWESVIPWIKKNTSLEIWLKGGK